VGAKIKLRLASSDGRAVPVGDIKNGAGIPGLRAAVGQAQGGRAAGKSDGRIVVRRADSHLQRAERLSSSGGAPLALAQSQQAGMNDGSVCVLKKSAIGDGDVFDGQSAALERVIESTRGATLEREFLGA